MKFFNSKNNIENKERILEQDYDILFINWIVNRIENATFSWDLKNETIRTFNFTIDKQLKKYPDKIVNILELKKTKRTSIFSNDYLIKNTIKSLKKTINKSLNKNKTLILWITIWDEWLPLVKEILEQLRTVSDNLVIVWWWPSLKKYDKDFSETLFEQWFDLLNIWWWKEFVDMVWELNSKKLSFKREAGWKLDFDWEFNYENIIFSNSNTFVKVWGQIPVAPYLEKWTLSINFWTTCFNNCKYCIVSKEKTINDLVNKTIKNVNSYLGHIANEDIKVNLNIKDPNPHYNLKKYWKLLDELNFDWIHNISWFWDIYSFAREWYAEELLEFIEKYKHNWVIAFWRDVVQKENDWDIIWKTVWNKLIKKEDYDKVEKNFFYFLEELEKQRLDWIKTPTIEINYILHPDMDEKLFLKKFKELDKIKHSYKWKILPRFFTLQMYSWSLIKEENKWYFMPFDKLDKKFLGLSYTVDVSFFWEKYKNSKLLDAYTLSNFIDIFNREQENDFFYDILKIINWEENDLKIINEIFIKESLEEIVLKIKNWFKENNLSDVVLEIVYYLVDKWYKNKYVLSILNKYLDYVQYREEYLEKIDRYKNFK